VSNALFQTKNNCGEKLHVILHYWRFFRLISRVENGVSFNKERAEKFFLNVARNATTEVILSPLIQSKIHVTNNGKMAEDAKMTLT